MAFQLARDGSIHNVMIQPRTPLWDCVTTALAKQRMPPPPRDDFWTSGDVQ